MNATLLKETGVILSSKEPSLTAVPEHIAIIMDGNRRWAKERGLPSIVGHWKGASVLSKIVRAAANLGVKTLTVYTFSTENWRRSSYEIEALMRLYKSFLMRQQKEMIREGVRLLVIGDPSKLPADIRKILNETIEATKQGTKIDLVMAFNYGGRDEITRAVQAIVNDCLSGKIAKDAITEDMISGYLDTAKWKDPELLIRTSGENRVSNFLLWQISYTEVLVVDTLWPDFKEQDLLKALFEYQNRNPRLGK